MIRMGVGGFGWHALNFNTSAQYNLNEKNVVSGRNIGLHMFIETIG